MVVEAAVTAAVTAAEAAEAEEPEEPAAGGAAAVDLVVTVFVADQFHMHNRSSCSGERPRALHSCSQAPPSSRTSARRSSLHPGRT